MKRFAEYLNKMLMIGASERQQEHYEAFVDAQDDKPKELTFYERMKIDEIMRGHKEVEEHLNPDTSKKVTIIAPERSKKMRGDHLDTQ